MKYKFGNSKTSLKISKFLTNKKLFRHLIKDFQMDLFFLIAGALLLILGFLGTFIPVLPGAPLAWLGLLLSYFSKYTNSSIAILVITAIIAIAVSVLDNIFPVLLTKKSGGSKAGTIGSTIGLVIGLFTGPWGIILGPFIGAFVGEMIHDASDMKHVFKAALGSFKGFLLGTGMKMIAVAAFIWIFVITLINHQ